MRRVTVVTGAAGAMGSACADALADTADELLRTDLDDGDLGEAAFVDELVDRVRSRGTLGALVHTAGLSPSMAGWEEVLRVDLVATARLLDAFLPLVGPGSVAVCLSSVSAHMGAFDADMDAVLDDPLAPDLVDRFREAFGGEPDPGSTYRLAKRGVVRACERAAVPWGARGGRVVSVSPGLIDTGMGRLELAENPIKEQLAAMTPVRSAHHDGSTVLPGAVADIAAAVVFLCSPQAGFVSGCDLRVDGGLLAALGG